MYIDCSRSERKKIIKIIEKHLKNYNSYKVAILNIKEQLERIRNRNVLEKEEKTLSYRRDKYKTLENNLMEFELLVESIDRSLEDLSETEVDFIRFRYFMKWSIDKSAMNLGYSAKAIFSMRNQIMDRLMISLSSIIQIEEAMQCK
ncbi:hypothetical protein [Gracilibacillus sp. JCM 18860]|uniref:hypothetical protein n=1 Tax=Gracilibacillus sp. JCM 18860 TaxID=1306159 RepID=UPI0006D136EE